MGLGDPLREREDEFPVVLDLLGGGLALEQRDGGGQVLRALLLERLRRAVPVAVDLRLLRVEGGGVAVNDAEVVEVSSIGEFVDATVADQGEE